MAESAELTKGKIGKQLSEQVVAIRERRRTVELRWLKSRRIWMDADLERRYIPENGIFRSIPSARRVGERTVTRCTAMIMPVLAKRFDIQPATMASQRNLSNVDSYMNFVYKKRIPTRSIINQLARCALIYGRPVLKTSVRVYNSRVWPIQRAVDPFAFYMFPETASDFEDTEIVFEDYLFSYDRYASLSRKYDWLESINPADLDKPMWPYHLTERLAYSGITDPTQNVANLIEYTSDQLRKTTTAFVSLTEVWLKREDKLYQVFIAWNVKNGPKTVGFIRSKYDDPLYRTVSHRPLPGETYTNSQFEDITDLELLQRDQLNKFQDAVDWEQGFVLMNSQQRHDSWRVKGRSIWLTQDDPRSQMQFVQPPISSTNQLRAWQIYLGMMNSMGGAGTIAEGQPGRNMPRAGGAVNNLINLGMADIEDMAKLIEGSILTPGAADVFAVTQFIPESQLIIVPGAETDIEGIKSSIIRKQDLQGSYEFEWIGSSQYQDEGSRAQRVLIFLNMVSQPPMMQALAQRGYTPDFVELLRMSWRYVLGERGLSDVLVKISDMQAIVASEQPPKPTNGASNGSGNNGQSANGTASSGQSGLQYNLPALTSGFVQQ